MIIHTGQDEGCILGFMKILDEKSPFKKDVVDHAFIFELRLPRPRTPKPFSVTGRTVDQLAELELAARAQIAAGRAV